MNSKKNKKYKIVNTKVSIWAFSNMTYIFQKLAEKSLPSFAARFHVFLCKK